jgi:hypothetical protein
MMLGSVSRYAAMHACCPVVVVREETSAVHREVVVGIRDPRDSDTTLAYAFDEAGPAPVWLTLSGSGVADKLSATPPGRGLRWSLMPVAALNCFRSFA